MIRCDMKTDDAYVNDVGENRVEEKRVSVWTGCRVLFNSTGVDPDRWDYTSDYTIQIIQNRLYKCPSVLPEMFYK